MTSHNLLLYRLAELMLEHQQHLLLVDTLFEDDTIGEFVKSVQIDSPYQQMLLEGVLTESIKEEKLFVSFTVEGYFHYVLGNVIFQKTDGKSAEALKSILELNGLNGAKEGIEQCLIRDIETEKFDRVFECIDFGNEFAGICVLPLTKAFLLGHGPLILQNLFQNETENDYEVLLKVLNQLRISSASEMVQQVFQEYSKNRDVSIIEKQIWPILKLHVFFWNYLDSSLLQKNIHKILKRKKTPFINLNEQKQSEILIDLNNVLVNRGLLKLSYRFNQRFQLLKSDVKELVNHYYNFIYPMLELGKFEDAEKIFLKCMEGQKNNGYFLNWSGFIYQAWYELESNDPQHLNKAFELYHLSSKCIDQEYGNYSIRKYENLENLGYSYGLTGDHQLAIQYLDQAINIVSKTFRSNIVYALGNLYEMKAMSLFELEEFDEALDLTYLSDQCKLLQVEKDSPELAWNHCDRAQIYRKMGETEKALESFSLALNIRIQSLGKNNPLTKSTQKEYKDLVRIAKKQG